MFTNPPQIEKRMQRLPFWLAAAVFAAIVLIISGPRVFAALADTEEAIYIVTLDNAPLATYSGGLLGLPATSPAATGSLRLDPTTPASVAYRNFLATQQAQMISNMELTLGRPLDIAFQYDTALNGIAVTLTGTEANTIALLPGVSNVQKDYVRYLHTDNGPGWIGAPGIWNGTDTGGLPGTKGEGMVVGIIDTGINHDHPSFADVGGDGYDHTNPRGQFYGVCDPLTGLPFCNDKLIGLYDFTGTTPFDDNGHGSHTASTTAGNVINASLIAPTTTIDRTISGVAPHANIIAYKACVTTPAIGTCPISGILGAINQATLDQVDVINFSIGGTSSDPWSDLDSQAFFSARSAGIFVAASAGNEGPGAATLGSPADAPWVLSVAASTHNRKYVNGLINMSGGATAVPADITGASVTSGYGPATIVYAGDYGNALCGEGTAEAPINPFLPGTFNGEIVVCDRGTFARVDKARFVGEAGAGGFVLANDIASGDSLVGDAYAIPGVHISYADGQVLKAWLASGSGHTGTIAGTSANEDFANGDVMASFSSRGPNPAAADLVKPDITAPGVDILAAFNTPVGSIGTDPEFGIISGTSMSSPHMAGSAVLMRAVHPDWTPDEVKSALMTTAFNSLPGNGSEVHVIYKEDGTTPADPFDMGAGRANLWQAAEAALVLDETPANYNAANPSAGGDPKQLNIPSLGNGNCAGTCSWTRTVKSTAVSSVTWTAVTSAPADIALTVTPSSFTLAPGESQTLTITADVSGFSGSSGWQFGQVTLQPDTAVPTAHFPVALIPQAGGSVTPQLALHFQGNLDEGCTGNGANDLATCNGPFLDENPVLDDNPAAQFGPVSAGLDGTAARNLYDPNWVWNLTETTTLEGKMTVEWWASCSACGAGVASADWNIRIWADGVEQFEQRISATPALPNIPSKLVTSVILPTITANSAIVLQIDPVFIDSQQGSIIYYDSTQACTETSAEGPCDSVAYMPVVGLVTPTPPATATNTPEPTATNTPMPTATNTPMPTATNTPEPTATNTPQPTATNPPPTATAVPNEPTGGGKVTGGGWVYTNEGDKINFGFQAKDVDGRLEGQLQLNDHGLDINIHLDTVTAVGSVVGNCGGITDNPNAIEFQGSGTYNDSAATFRVCVEDNNGSRGSNPDLFYLECLTGCTYNTGDRTPDNSVDGGGQIHLHIAPNSGSANKQHDIAKLSASTSQSRNAQTTNNAAVMILDPLLLNEANSGSLQAITVYAYDADGELLSNVSVTIERTLANGGITSWTVVTNANGLALLNVAVLAGEAEFIAYNGELSSNAININGLLP